MSFLKHITRFLCLLLAGVMLANAALAHGPELSFWAERKKAQAETQLARLPISALPHRSLNVHKPLQAPPPKLASQIDALKLESHHSNKLRELVRSLPASAGSIRKIDGPASGASGRVVFHMEDVHLHSEAQANMGAAVRALASQGLIDAVFLEGAFKPIDISQFRAFPHKEALKKAADYFLNKGEMSGPLHAGLLLEAPFPPLIGVDDPIHYDANVRAYQDSQLKLASIKIHLEADRKRLEKEKSRLFQGELRDWDQTASAYHSDRIGLGDYLEFLDRLVQRHNHPALGFQAEIFLEAVRMEKSLDDKRVEEERARLITALMSRITPQESEDFAYATLLFRQGEIRHADFYDRLRTLSSARGVELKRFPHMNDYLRYVLLADSLDSEAVLDEVRRIENSLAALLAKTDEEKTLVKESRLADLKEKLVQFSLTRSEWKAYQAFKGGAPLPTFERFYEEADARDERMADNILSALSTSKVSSALFVAGGYHSKGITERLKKAGVTVLTFTPRVTRIDPNAAGSYLSVFAQEKAPLDQLFEGEKLFLMPRPDAVLPRVALVAASLDGTDGAFQNIYPNSNLQQKNRTVSSKGDIEVVWQNSGTRFEVGIQIPKNPNSDIRVTSPVSSAKAGVQGVNLSLRNKMTAWVPAFAGTTGVAGMMVFADWFTIPGLFSGVLVLIFLLMMVDGSGGAREPIADTPHDLSYTRSPSKEASWRLQWLDNLANMVRQEKWEDLETLRDHVLTHAGWADKKEWADFITILLERRNAVSSLTTSVKAFIEPTQPIVTRSPSKRKGYRWNSESLRTLSPRVLTALDLFYGLTGKPVRPVSLIGEVLWVLGLRDSKSKAPINDLNIYRMVREANNALSGPSRKSGWDWLLSETHGKHPGADQPDALAQLKINFWKLDPLEVEILLAIYGITQSFVTYDELADELRRKGVFSRLHTMTGRTLSSVATLAVKKLRGEEKEGPHSLRVAVRLNTAQLDKLERTTFFVRSENTQDPTTEAQEKWIFTFGEAARNLLQITANTVDLDQIDEFNLQKLNERQPSRSGFEGTLLIRGNPLIKFYFYPVPPGSSITRQMKIESVASHRIARWKLGPRTSILFTGKNYISLQIPIPGVPLSEVEQPSLSLSLARKAGEALGMVHKEGIVVRDLSPHNIRVSFDASGAPHVAFNSFYSALLKDPSGRGREDEYYALRKKILNAVFELGNRNVINAFGNGYRDGRKLREDQMKSFKKTTPGLETKEEWLSYFESLKNSLLERNLRLNAANYAKASGELTSTNVYDLSKKWGFDLKPQKTKKPSTSRSKPETLVVNQIRKSDPDQGGSKVLGRSNRQGNYGGIIELIEEAFLKLSRLPRWTYALAAGPVIENGIVSVAAILVFGSDDLTSVTVFWVWGYFVLLHTLNFLSALIGPGDGKAPRYSRATLNFFVSVFIAVSNVALGLSPWTTSSLLLHAGANLILYFSPRLIHSFQFLQRILLPGRSGAKIIDLSLLDKKIPASKLIAFFTLNTLLIVGYYFMLEEWHTVTKVVILAILAYLITDFFGQYFGKRRLDLLQLGWVSIILGVVNGVSIMFFYYAIEDWSLGARVVVTPIFAISMNIIYILFLYGIHVAFPSSEKSAFNLEFQWKKIWFLSRHPSLNASIWTAIFSLHAVRHLIIQSWPGLDAYGRAILAVVTVSWAATFISYTVHEKSSGMGRFLRVINKKMWADSIFLTVRSRFHFPKGTSKHLHRRLSDYLSYVDGPELRDLITPLLPPHHSSAIPEWLRFFFRLVWVLPVVEALSPTASTGERKPTINLNEFEEFLQKAILVYYRKHYGNLLRKFNDGSAFENEQLAYLLDRSIEVYLFPLARDLVKERKHELMHALLMHLVPVRGDQIEQARIHMVRTRLFKKIFGSQDPNIWKPALEMIFELLSRPDLPASKRDTVFFPILKESFSLPNFAVALLIVYEDANKAAAEYALINHPKPTETQKLQHEYREKLFVKDQITNLTPALYAEKVNSTIMALAHDSPSYADLILSAIKEKKSRIQYPENAPIHNLEGEMEKVLKEWSSQSAKVGKASWVRVKGTPHSTTPNVESPDLTPQAPERKPDQISAVGSLTGAAVAMVFYGVFVSHWEAPVLDGVMLLLIAKYLVDGALLLLLRILDTVQKVRAGPNPTPLDESRLIPPFRDAGNLSARVAAGGKDQLFVNKSLMSLLPKNLQHFLFYFLIYPHEIVHMKGIGVSPGSGKRGLLGRALNEILPTMSQGVPLLSLFKMKPEWMMTYSSIFNAVAGLSLASVAFAFPPTQLAFFMYGFDLVWGLIFLMAGVGLVRAKETIQALKARHWGLIVFSSLASVLASLGFYYVLPNLPITFILVLGNVSVVSSLFLNWVFLKEEGGRSRILTGVGISFLVIALMIGLESVFNPALFEKGGWIFVGVLVGLSFGIPLPFMRRVMDEAEPNQKGSNRYYGEKAKSIFPALPAVTIVLTYLITLPVLALLNLAKGVPLFSLDQAAHLGLSAPAVLGPVVLAAFCIITMWTLYWKAGQKNDTHHSRIVIGFSSAAMFASLIQFFLLGTTPFQTPFPFWLIFPTGVILGNLLGSTLPRKPVPSIIEGPGWKNQLSNSSKGKGVSGKSGYISIPLYITLAVGALVLLGGTSGTSLFQSNAGVAVLSLTSVVLYLIFKSVAQVEGVPPIYMTTRKGPEGWRIISPLIGSFADRNFLNSSNNTFLSGGWRRTQTMVSSEGGNRKGLEKSLSSVTRIRPSSFASSAIIRSVVEGMTRRTSKPSDLRNLNSAMGTSSSIRKRMAFPMVNSIFGRGGIPGFWRIQPQNGERPGYGPLKVEDNNFHSRSLLPSHPLQEVQGPGKPESVFPGSTVSRGKFPDQRKYIVRAMNPSGFLLFSRLGEQVYQNQRANLPARMGLSALFGFSGFFLVHLLAGTGILTPLTSTNTLSINLLVAFMASALLHIFNNTWLYNHRVHVRQKKWLKMSRVTTEISRVSAVSAPLLGGIPLDRTFLRSNQNNLLMIAALRALWKYNERYPLSPLKIKFISEDHTQSRFSVIRNEFFYHLINILLDAKIIESGIYKPENQDDKGQRGMSGFVALPLFLTLAVGALAFFAGTAGAFHVYLMSAVVWVFAGLAGPAALLLFYFLLMTVDPLAAVHVKGTHGANEPKGKTLDSSAAGLEAKQMAGSINRLVRLAAGSNDGRGDALNDILKEMPLQLGVGGKFSADQPEYTRGGLELDQILNWSRELASINPILGRLESREAEGAAALLIGKRAQIEDAPQENALSLQGHLVVPMGGGSEEAIREELRLLEPLVRRMEKNRVIILLAPQNDRENYILSISPLNPDLRSRIRVRTVTAPLVHSGRLLSSDMEIFLEDAMDLRNQTLVLLKGVELDEISSFQPRLSQMKILLWSDLVNAFVALPSSSLKILHKLKTHILTLVNA